MTSPKLIVPVEVTQTTDLETFITEGFRDSAAVLGRGVRIYWYDGVFQQATALGEDGEMLKPPPARRSFYSDCGLRLTPDDAKTFGNELQASMKNIYRSAKKKGKANGISWLSVLRPSKFLSSAQSSPLN